MKKRAPPPLRMDAFISDTATQTWSPEHVNWHALSLHVDPLTSHVPHRSTWECTLPRETLDFSLYGTDCSVLFKFFVKEYRLSCNACLQVMFFMISWSESGSDGLRKQAFGVRCVAITDFSWVLVCCELQVAFFPSGLGDRLDIDSLSWLPRGAQG